MDVRHSLPVGPDKSGWLSDCWSIMPESRTQFAIHQNDRLVHNYRLAEVGLAPCRGHRGVDEIERAGAEALYLTFYTKGCLNLINGPHDLAIATGDIVSWNPGFIGSFSCQTDINGITVSFPRDLVKSHVGDIDAIYGRKMSTENPVYSILRDNIINLYNSAERMSYLQMKYIMSAVMEVAYHGFIPPVSRGGSSYMQKVLRRVRERILDALYSEDLSPANIAMELGISVRNLHNLFSTEGTTFSEFVRKQRLSRAKEALASGAFRTKSITEISHRFGFCDSAHFSKSFKREFGVSPKQFRMDHG